MTKSFDVHHVRKDFNSLRQMVYNKPLIYFDSAATAQKPQCVKDEICHYYEQCTANVHRGVHYLSEQATMRYNEAREFIAKFIHAKDASEIIFTRNTTEAINLVATSLGKYFFKDGDEIILTHMEHHSNIVPWVLLAKEKNLIIKVAPLLDDGSLDLLAWKGLFNNRTKLAAFTHASNALGTINPIKEMVEFAKSLNIPTLIDGAQGLHHIGADVEDMDTDFYCFSGHKAYGPTGIGVLYAKKKWLEQFPPYQSGGDMIKSVSFDEIIIADAPQKFEAGTPNIAGALGLRRALAYINDIGIDAIETYEKSLHDYAVKQMREFKNVRLVGTAENKVSLISFVVEGVHPHDISTIFDREGIAIRAGHLCAEPVMKRFGVRALSRTSFAFYNTHEEIDQFIRAFQRVFEVFRL